MGFTEDDLKKMGLVLLPDGTYGKPRKEHPSKAVKKTLSSSVTPEQLSFISEIPIASTDKGLIDNTITMRKITLTLFGVPMPKQSVRSHANGSFSMSKTGKKIYNVLHYQPKEMKDNTSKGQVEIRKQLPKDFVPFANEVRITKLQFVFPPLKAFQKIKGRMEDIHNGKFFKKTTKPDLDNTCKFFLDLMKGVVFTDDNLIVSINMEKMYGSGGMTIIELEGW